jgi:hypothetical protein
MNNSSARLPDIPFGGLIGTKYAKWIFHHSTCLYPFSDDSQTQHIVSWGTKYGLRAPIVLPRTLHGNLDGQRGIIALIIQGNNLLGLDMRPWCLGNVTWHVFGKDLQGCRFRGCGIHVFGGGQRNGNDLFSNG